MNGCRAYFRDSSVFNAARVRGLRQAAYPGLTPRQLAFSIVTVTKKAHIVARQTAKEGL